MYSRRSRRVFPKTGLVATRRSPALSKQCLETNDPTKLAATKISIILLVTMGERMRISRQDILKRLITKEGYQTYLEIGVSSGRLYKHIPLKDKTGVDPAWRAWYLLARGIQQTTSDHFFANNSKDFDLVFVDGLHGGKAFQAAFAKYRTSEMSNVM